MTSLIAPPAPPTVAEEQRLLIHGVDWKTYCVLRELLDSPGLRLTYLEGALELMSPSPRHEFVKTRTARFLELFALERDLPLHGYGSTTFKTEAKEAGLEPDECYVFGHLLAEVPDVAIEVVLKSGSIDKLEAYRRLGVPEVWFWLDGRFHVYELTPQGYQPREASRFFPGLDLGQLAALVQRDDHPAAVREFRDALRARG